MREILEFKKQKNHLICFDSDGCVMDTMDIKHKKCFAPCLIQEWRLESLSEAILHRWNEINLYSLTRGINRFKGLALALEEINEKYTAIPGAKALSLWVENAPALSDDAIAMAIKEYPEEDIFKKAYSWSKKVSQAVNNLKAEEKLPFPAAKRALEAACIKADIALVSSANKSAVIEEWQLNGLLDFVDVVTTQNDGSKADCIEKLVNKGYDKEKVIMCGDAEGDLKAAQENGVFFYPILVGKEKECWEEFVNIALPAFIGGSYAEYGEKKIGQFYNNLNIHNQKGGI